MVVEASFSHRTVMARELVGALGPRAGGVYVDVTLGGGGHSEQLLESEPGAVVVGFDRDPSALAAATTRLGRFGGRFRAEKASFDEVPGALRAMGLTQVDGLMADLGVSSPQLDEARRGMSFRHEGPLDMRMDPTRGETAAELIERLSAEELADVIYVYGEERRSRRIARCVKQADEAGELATTLDLRRAVVRAVGPARVGGVDPATRTFQAIRIAVNDELGQIEALLNGARGLLSPGGVLAVLSFHSLEDRLVKRAFQERGVWAPLWRKPQVPGDDEQAANPRARSAKLRAARRVSAEEGASTGRRGKYARDASAHEGDEGDEAGDEAGGGAVDEGRVSVSPAPPSVTRVRALLAGASEGEA